jgi:dTDP-D-glucose 4,6-dehydratase
MKLLVTGGAGFIGANFVDFVLKNRDYEIVVGDKLTYAGDMERLRDWKNDPRLAFYKVDITDHIDLSTEYKSIARGLIEIDFVDKKLGGTLILMAGYRNRLVHMYNIISDKELFQVIQSNMKDIENFVSEVKKYWKNVEQKFP